MQDLLHAREVDLRIFGEGMVPLHQQCARRQQQQKDLRFILPIKSLQSPDAIATRAGLAADPRLRSATHAVTAQADKTTY